jgi:hypothetical protein
LSEKFPYNSTYAFQENKLGMGREFEGLELVPFEFLMMSNCAIEPAIPLAEAGIREIPIEPVTITVSRATPPSPPGFWEKIGNWFDSVFDSSSESTAPKSMDKTVENLKPESTAETATETGKIYRVPGEQTKSGRPYIGRTKRASPAERGKGANDGRNRGGDTEVIDKYDPKNPGEGAYKEQKAIDKEGGIENLDNKRNEVRPDRMKDLENTYGQPKHQ